MDDIVLARRGFLGSVAGAFVSAPAIGRDVLSRLSGGLPKNPIPIDKLPENIKKPKLPDPTTAARASHSGLVKRINQEANRQTQIAMLTKYGPRPYLIRQAMETATKRAYIRFPPHIAAIRSFSDATKFRMSVEYYYEKELKSSVYHELSEDDKKYRIMHSKVRGGIFSNLLKTFGIPADKVWDDGPEDECATEQAEDSYTDQYP